MFNLHLNLSSKKSNLTEINLAILLSYEHIVLKVAALIDLQVTE